jgi:hypothetical protein
VRFFEDWLGSYDRREADMEECFDLGRGVVLSVMVQNARSGGSCPVQTARGIALLASGNLDVSLVDSEVERDARSFRT